MELSGKQKRFLRALGQKLPVSIKIGKAGLGGPFVQQVRQLLDHKELVKVRLLQGDRDQREQSAVELADKTESQVAGLVGRSLLLYRPNEQLDEPIVLPQGAAEEE